MSKKFNNTIFKSDYFQCISGVPIVIQQDEENPNWIEIFHKSETDPQKIHLCDEDIDEFIEVLKMFRDIIKQ